MGEMQTDNISEPEEADEAYACRPLIPSFGHAADGGNAFLRRVADDIDDLFGWLQAERAKDQQKAYAQPGRRRYCRAICARAMAP